MAEKHSSRIGGVLLLLFRILFTFFAIGTVVFIFSNSLESGAISSARSEEVTIIVNETLEKVDAGPVSEYTVRKLAHFSEYALLALWFTLCLRVYTRHYIRHISWPLFLILFTANIDETIQTFVAHRSGSVRDVWIDFGGGCVGVFAGLCVIIFLSGFWYLLGFGRHRK